MNENTESSFRFFRGLLRWWKGVRDWFARQLDVDEDRKTEIYISLVKSTTLKDILYWLQIFLSAGIAMLGLVMDSTAVIIGAMLISPLMGPILASGLALATGDLILAVRSLVNLLLSSLGAIFFALILVALLPFNEAGPEIRSRISPNTLDLGIALFSGAVGSVAICREVRGVVTSIPGVAIAVALMPPLCVIGFGFGVSLSVGFWDGLRFSTGGGLLYLTNLVAIVFTAMIVFILLRIDTPKVRARVREWRETDPESVWWKNVISRVPTLEKAREIRSMSLRLLMILLPLLLIFIPLSQSYNKLKTELVEKRQENIYQTQARNIWDEFLKDRQRESIVDQLRVKQNKETDQLEITLRVFDNTPFSPEEKEDYLTRLGKELNRRNDSIALSLIEIPTSARDTAEPQTAETPLPPTIAELQGLYLQGVKNALAGMEFPASARMLDYRLISSPDAGAEIQLYYLAAREIDVDARELLAAEIRRRLNLPNLNTNFERIPTEAVPITFENRGENIREEDRAALDRAGKNLQSSPRLKMEVALDREISEVILREKEETVRAYMAEKWSVPGDRIVFTKATDEERKDSVRIVLPE